MPSPLPALQLLSQRRTELRRTKPGARPACSAVSVALSRGLGKHCPRRFLSYGAHQPGMLFTSSSAPKMLHGGKVLGQADAELSRLCSIGVLLLVTVSMFYCVCALFFLESRPLQPKFADWERKLA